MRAVTRTGRRGVLAAVAVGLLAVAGCGAPPSGTTEVIPADRVPYQLLSPAENDVPELPTADEAQTSPQVFFTDTEARLTPATSTVSATGLQPVLRQLLANLATGPTEAQRRSGLSSALGPDVVLTLKEVVGTTATVDISLPVRGLAPDRLPLAVGQIVLTLTSVTGVDFVRLTQDGELVEAALPGGVRTPLPVSASSYRPLLAPGVVVAPKVDPVPAPVEDPAREAAPPPADPPPTD